MDLINAVRESFWKSEDSALLGLRTLEDLGYRVVPKDHLGLEITFVDGADEMAKQMIRALVIETVRHMNHRWLIYGVSIALFNGEERIV